MMISRINSKGGRKASFVCFLIKHIQKSWPVCRVNNAASCLFYIFSVLNFIPFVFFRIFAPFYQFNFYPNKIIIEKK